MRLSKHLNFRVGGQKINPSSVVKYLGIYIEEHLNWDYQIRALCKKLSRSNGFMSKLRHYVPKKALKSIYHSIFESHLIYACQVWGLKGNSRIQSLIKLQNKALRIISFKSSYDPVDCFLKSAVF